MPPDDAFPTPSFAALCEAAALAQNPDHVLCPAKRFTFDPIASPVKEQQDEVLNRLIGEIESDPLSFYSGLGK